MSEQQPAAGVSEPPILDMQHVSHRYPGHRQPGPLAVDDVSLSVDANELVCLLGPSGCGKSTLLRIAAGLERLQSGRVGLRGRIVADAAADVCIAAEHRHVGLVFQDSALFPHLSVLDNVAFGLDRLPARDRQQRARTLLEQLRMGDYVNAFPHQLSGGQQQRVALARALAPAPSLMLMDEPFASLDAGLRGRIRDDVLHALKGSGAGTVMVTHDPQEALFMADRIALMRDGRIVQSGRPETLYCEPADAFVARFFGEVNEIEGRVRGGAVATPLGPVPATGFADGAAVAVLVRPEALRITRVFDSPDADHSHVVAARLLGRYSLIHLCVHDADGTEHHLHAHAHGVFLPTPGQAVELALDVSQVFVFARAGTAADAGADAGADAAA